MPNVGKPSKGCKNCRDRKVKCDQKRPSCSQCLRVHKECYGYRDPLTLMFKNESDVVARKAKNRYQELSKQNPQKPRNRKDSRTSDPEFSGSPSSAASPFSVQVSEQQVVLKRRDPPSASMIWELNPSIEDQAIGFFLASYVIKPTFVPRGQFDFLPELLSRPDTEEILQKSATAAGLAALANATKSPHISKKAQREYVSALALTNKALGSAQNAMKDSTLISVIMLGMYENFTHQSKDSLKAWAKHVKGACTLISLRGRSMFGDSVGLRVFQQFYGTALLVALENKSEVSAGLTELWEMGTQINDYSIPGKQWTTKIVRFMRHAIELTADTTSDPVHMVDTATTLDKELNDIRDFIPEIWKYETVYIEKPSEHVYGNSYHIYLDPWLAQMWNNLRAVRLVLHKVIRVELIKGLNRCPPLFQEDEAQAQIKASEQQICATSAAICASTPQITGQIPFPDLPTTKTKVPTSCADLFDPQDPKFKLHPPGTFWNPLRPTGLHNLIWPLYALGVSSLCPYDLREWAINRLHFVALKIGTRQALSLANDLKDLNSRGAVFEIDEETDVLKRLR
ncbi:hypothetical protein K505DRAFT_76582 [Melanomma pulvis-pyrius CBS 109.77]|uniref:Zn(2)-C6 fungal-type domain-containing protein n=1 Tax=Melanomma pulvis-pyrius CBS 109.77 TaxID=1314802 RepID=A0A6A6X3B6_9PLEO|nr:hypothetical protein K505DRAFT_76582 [Melanomma pulvis-pyrius CBS 109.77]